MKSIYFWIVSILATIAMALWRHGFLMYLIFMGCFKLHSIVKSFLLRQTHEKNNENFKKFEESLTNPCWTQEEFVDLAEISIWERPVDNLRSSYPNGKVKGSGPLKHDYIIIKIKLASGSESFVVEKVAELVRFEMYNLESKYYVKYTRGEGPETGVTCRFKLELQEARVPVQDLISDLVSGIPEYDLLLMNCWSYAYSTTKKVIELCAGDEELEIGEKKSLKAGLEDLENVKRTEPIYRVWGLIIVAALIIIPARVLLSSRAGQKTWDSLYSVIPCIVKHGIFILGNLTTAVLAHVYINHPGSWFRWKLHKLGWDQIALVLLGRGYLFVILLFVIWRGRV